MENNFYNVSVKINDFDGNRIYANISETHKTFVWLWSKTGSTHMSKLLQNFDFKHYWFEGNERKLKYDKLRQMHNCYLFDGHEEYKLLASVRNPYSRMVSSYKMNNVKNFSKDKFRDYLEDVFYGRRDNELECISLIKRKPDYFVRMEHMFEDYSKIPFIIKSDFYKSGKLKEFTEVKVNPNPEKYTDWREFYSKESADIVYYNMVRYFETFGYDKNSWKI